jgi:hypothetical protein
MNSKYWQQYKPGSKENVCPERCRGVQVLDSKFRRLPGNTLYQDGSNKKAHPENCRTMIAVIKTGHSIRRSVSFSTNILESLNGIISKFSKTTALLPTDQTVDTRDIYRYCNAGASNSEQVKCINRLS